MISSFRSHLLIVTAFLFVLFVGHNLNPFDGQTFVGHDETQAARILEFAYNITQGQFPPRISPHMSFGLGYPIFNYYAPTAYWITSLLHLSGMNVAQSLEISYFLALFVGMTGFYIFLRKYFGVFASCAASTLYISSPVIAVDIFVRANLAEIWFYALFPWALALMQRVSRKTFFITCVVVAAVFTTHNIFSLVSVPLLLLFSWINKSKMQAASVIIGLVMASYFLIPAIGELNQVQASQIATITEYKDHFLCPLQLWYSTWGYGGSSVGCINDGMSFMLGKIHILSGIAGIGFFVWSILKKIKQKNLSILISILVLTVGSLFMTLPFSEPLWKLFEPIFSIFQFPWRFLLFVVFGISFFSAYAIQSLPKHFAVGTSVLVILAVVVMQPKFFVGQQISVQNYLSTFASDEYIRNTAAFKVAEYLPTSASYKAWRQLEKDAVKPQGEGIGFDTYEMEVAQNTIMPIHYAQYWSIMIDDKPFVPQAFDNLGRPRIKIEEKPVTVTVQYSQTRLQQLANTITLFTTIIVLIYSQPHTWRSKKT